MPSIDTIPTSSSAFKCSQTAESSLYIVWKNKWLNKIYLLKIHPTVMLSQLKVVSVQMMENEGRSGGLGSCAVQASGGWNSEKEPGSLSSESLKSGREWCVSKSRSASLDEIPKVWIGKGRNRNKTLYECIYNRLETIAFVFTCYYSAVEFWFELVPSICTVYIFVYICHIYISIMWYICPIYKFDG